MGAREEVLRLLWGAGKGCWRPWLRGLEAVLSLLMRYRLILPDGENYLRYQQPYFS